ncbi:Uu.00g116570.m01.CDS01 [Anthostomella pinea]|uniref:Uu.00g116570.m01.CDS01 n=1 Tax=Anthostomella pinea TaxID=933095 RepID=A0AAI8VG36_9PEZI|nr:Uu.00g116570.m01.CDS01 [Anthostomella pinea]
MHCYCANYYGAVNCHNKVTQFGDRCRLCTIMNEGNSASFKLSRHQQRQDQDEDQGQEQDHQQRQSYLDGDECYRRHSGSDSSSSHESYRGSGRGTGRPCGTRGGGSNS